MLLSLRSAVAVAAVLLSASFPVDAWGNVKSFSASVSRRSQLHHQSSRKAESARPSTHISETKDDGDDGSDEVSVDNVLPPLPPEMRRNIRLPKILSVVEKQRKQREQQNQRLRALGSLEQIQAQVEKDNRVLLHLCHVSTTYEPLHSRRALSFLRNKHIQPDTEAYNTVIKALAKCSTPESTWHATTAQSLWREMETIHDEWKKKNKGQSSSKPIVKPDEKTITTVMDAFSRHKSLSAVRTVDAILASLQGTEYESSTIAHNMALSAWSKLETIQTKPKVNEEGESKDLAHTISNDDDDDDDALEIPPYERCMEILRQAESKGCTDVISYTSAAHALARSGLPDAGERTEALLRRAPFWNARFYSVTMDAWSRSSPASASRAHALLIELEERASEAKKNGVTGTELAELSPNFILYSTIINCYAKSSPSDEPFKAYKAYALLKRITGKSSRIAYNCVINACSKSDPQLIADALEKGVREKDFESVNGMPLFDLVCHVFDEMCNADDWTLHPDQFTYGTVLKAVNHLKDPENPDAHVQFTHRVFDSARTRGYVNGWVIAELHRILPGTNLVPTDSSHPYEWSRKARLQRWQKNLTWNRSSRSLQT